ncbi:MAG: NAD(+) synthase, partial [Treponemataceae bacterium]|nr:NAD(+) synthase [Treponemataceae bacterium]
VVFPELSIAGYTCGDLFQQQTLQRAAVQALERIAGKTASLHVMAVVGLPFADGASLYNCAAVLYEGRVCALVPKTYPPNYGEFYEMRHFSPAPPPDGRRTAFVSERHPEVPFGTDILIRDARSDFCLCVEVCEDVWSPAPPSVPAALSGATVVANLSASNEIIGKAEYRRLLIRSHSARTVCAYVYADAGHDESTQDMVFAAHNIIAENGALLAESRLFSKELLVADVDVERIVQERRRMTTFSQAAARTVRPAYRSVFVELREAPSFGRKHPLLRTVAPHPFVPSGEGARARRCAEVVALQAEGLAKRLRHIRARSAVVGLSGGLDSTLALLVAAKAFDMCGIGRSGIRAVTMPCFGTTDRTYRNACALARECGASLQEVPIAESVRRHFQDIGHDESVHDAAYENCQARERTQVLMDIANQIGGIVVGTGDLSELALGWCTYNGDQMSMYGVNSSVPKTLVRHLVAWFSESARSEGREALAAVLDDILATPVSPELLPPENGAIAQRTEDIVGPYELHDFFLYYMLRFGFSPEKIAFLAGCSGLPFSRGQIVRWLRVFYRRFFSQQFKRSCMPDGAKIGTVSLSPRGDWRMPSDASAAAWLEEAGRMQ